MKLSENFSLHEFKVSADYPELVHAIEFSPLDIVKIQYLVHVFFQPLRTGLKNPLKILSGKRSRGLNTAIGGSVRSDHMFTKGSAAADFTCKGIESVFNLLKQAENDYVYGQLIYYPKKKFIHISVPTVKHVGEHFVIDK